MKEPIEDVQVYHCFLCSDVVPELSELQKPSSEQGKCPQRSKPELGQLVDGEAYFLAETCTNSEPSLYGLCTDSVSTLYRTSTDPVPILYRPYTESVPTPTPTLYGFLTDSVPSMYQQPLRTSLLKVQMLWIFFVQKVSFVALVN